MPQKKTKLTLIFLLFFGILFSQEIEFERIPNELGLSQNFISSLYQDSQGFLWVGTQDGLNRYDGYQFKVYQYDPFDPTTISNNYIKWIFEDSQHRMWVGTTQGLNLFDRSIGIFHRCLPSQNKFSSPSPITKNYPSISHQNISHIMEDREGNIWVSTMREGINKIELPKNATDFSNAKFTVFNATEDKNSLWDRNIRNLVEDEEGTIWVNTWNQLSKIYKDSTTQKYQIKRLYWKDFDPQWARHQQEDFFYFEYGKETVDTFFHTIFKDEKGMVWIKTAGGLGKWIPSQQQFKLFHIDEDLANFERRPFRGANGAGVIDDRGNVWLGGANAIIVYDTLTHKIIDRKQNDGKSTIDIVKTGYNKIIEDQSSNIWLGTNGNGLFKFNPYLKKFLGKKSTLWKGGSVRTLLETSDGTLWTSMTDLRLLKHNPKTNETSPVRLDRDRWVREVADKMDYIHCMQEDGEGNLWLGGDRGLFKFELENGEILDWQFFEIKRNDTSQENCSVLDLHVDANGDIWLMTHFEFGKFNPITKQFQGNDYLKVYGGDRLEISFPTIYEHADKIFWLGTNDGLLKFDAQKQSFEMLTNDPENLQSLSHNNIKCITPDPQQPQRILWIGTGGGGMNRFDLETNTFTCYKKKDGLADNVVYGILSDEDGFLWMSTNQGISKFDPQNEVFQNYNIDDGLQNNEFNTKSYFKNKEGKLFFGGINGFNSFFPKDIQNSTFKAPIVITDLLLANKKVTIDSPNSPLQKDISQLKELTLSYQEKVFSFEFSSLDLTNSKQNKYAYKLENFDNEWQYIGTQRQATFTNIDPGTYIFKVKGTNYSGVWNEEGTSLKIIILPPWWQTWWAYLLYFLGTIGLIYAFYKFQFTRQIEKQEVKRLEELNALKTRLYTNITHEFRTPLTVIMGMADNIKGHENEKHLIHRNSKNLLHLINQLLDISKLEGGKLKLNKTQSDIIPYFRYLTESFYSMAQEKEIRLVFYSEVEELIMDFDEWKMQHIIYNLLSNALKFTEPRGEIIFHANYVQNNGTSFLELKIKDTGIGIGADKIDLIFERFYQADNSDTRKNEGTGIGLALTKELTQLMNGTISVKSKKGKGTTFKIILPITNVAPHKSIDEVLLKNNENTKIILPLSENELSQSESTSTASNETESNKIPLILLVEDNQDVATYIKQLLSPKYRLQIAINGKLGVAKAKEIVPDLIISDVMMPEMGGYELTDMLKEDEITSHIPIILLTAKAAHDDKIQGLKVGADAYLVKPFDKEELLVRVEKLLALRTVLQERYAKVIFEKEVVPIPEPTPTSTFTIEDIFIQKLKEKVEEQMSNPGFRPSHLAEAANLSQSQLYRKLKAIINETPTNFILKIRLQNAMVLLKTTNQNISEIAYSLGFNDPNYFTRVFNKEFGNPPTNFRK